jgi:hypothetical protein
MIRACGTLVEYTRFQDWRVSVTLKKKKKECVPKMQFKIMPQLTSYSCQR